MKKLGLGLLVLLYFGSYKEVKAQPVIKINPIDKRCVKGSIINLNNYVTIDDAFKTLIVEAGNPNEFCIDASAMALTGDPAGGIWTGKGIAGNQFYPSLATPGVHDLTYTYKNVICIVNKKVKYTVWDLPVVTAGTLSGDTIFCRNYGIVQLVGQPSGGYWSGPGVSGNTFNTAIGADVVTKYTLRYEYTDSSFHKNYADLTIWVKPEPTVMINPPSGRICFGKQITISASYKHADGVFWWKGPQSDGYLNGSKFLSPIGYDPGWNDLKNLYFWIYIQTTHHESICLSAYDSMKFTMSEMPVVDFTASPQTGGTPLTVQFTDSSTIKVGNLQSWKWWFGDGEVSNDTNPVHTYKSAAKYDVTLSVISDAGCKGGKSKLNFIATVIEPGNQLLLYPNPAHGELFIENPENEPLNMILSDLYGKTLFTNYIKPGKNTIDISSLKPGIYVLKFNTSNIYRLVIE